MWVVALRSVWKQNLRMMTRYLFNTLSSLITLYIVFALMFYGAKSIGSGTMGLGDTLEAMFAGYVTWMLALTGCTDLAWSITNEAQTGTLEQLCLSPLGYRWILAFSQSFNLATNVLLVGVLTLSMSLTTGQSIHLDFLSVIPVVTAIYLQAVGLGFALAGLALMYKRIQAFFQVVQFALIGILFVPLDTLVAARYLPLAMGRALLQEVLLRGTMLWRVPWAEVAPVFGSTILWMAIGLGCFAAAESRARRRGLLGQY